MLSLTPSVQSPAAYDRHNLSAVQVAARLAAAASATVRASMRQAMQDAGYDYDIHPKETAAGLTDADLTFGYGVGDARRYGATGDGSTDDTAALSDWWAVGKQGVRLWIPAGTYLTTQALVTGVPMMVRGEFGARIKLTAAAECVMDVDFTTGIHGWDYFCDIRGLILDGNGNADFGLALRHIINGTFDDIRVTNVVESGMLWAWVQLCSFTNFTCSKNVEAFTTTPVNGIREIMANGRGSAANIVINPTIEHVSGAGIIAETLINTLFMQGTSEGNDVGIEFGAAEGNGCTSNVVVGMDLEVNATSDVILRATARANNFIGLMAGYESPAIQILGGWFNVFSGGSSAGFNLDANSAYNKIEGVRVYGVGATVTDAGAFNTVNDVINGSTVTPVADKPFRRRDNFVGASATINCATTSYAVVNATGAALTINAPLNAVDGMELDICIHNISGGAIVTTWNAAFKIAGWVDPSSATNRTARFRYDANYGAWYVVSMTPADVAN